MSEYTAEVTERPNQDELAQARIEALDEMARAVLVLAALIERGEA